MSVGQKCKKSTYEGRRYCPDHLDCYEARNQASLLNVAETLPRPNIGRYTMTLANVKPCNLGERIVCPKCSALMFDFEQSAASRKDVPAFNLCCKNGRLADIQVYPCLPNELQALLSDESQEAVYFCRNIRAINTLLSFASVNSESNPQLPSHNRGVFTYSISADVNHVISDVALNPGNAKFGGIYFFEPRQQLDIRRNIMPDLFINAQDMIGRLQAMMLRYNPFANQYRNMSSILQQRPSTHFYLYMTLSEAMNAPAQDDVAVLIPEHSNVTKKHILLNLIDNGPVRYKIIQPSSPFYDPLCYPLLLPFGNSGWTPEMAAERRGGRQVSVAEFYRYFFRTK